MALYLIVIILLIILFVIIIKNLLGDSFVNKNSKIRAKITLIIGVIGLIWSLNPIITIFSFGIIPSISLAFLISGLVRLKKIKKIQNDIHS